MAIAGSDIEIERKFLVTSDAYQEAAFKRSNVQQGYLNSSPERCVRVRLADDQAFLTVKGPSDAAGISRYEWEKNIEVADAHNLMTLCEPGKIMKTRFYIKVGHHTFEVDEFAQSNQGLVLAEIELRDENEPFEQPGWLGKEVTGDERYYNAYLSKYPFTTW